MLIVLSPSKTIDFNTPALSDEATGVLFPDEARELMLRLSSFSMEEIMAAEKVSPKIARDTYGYIQSFPLSLSKEKEALYAYTGNVYDKLDVATLDAEALRYLNGQLRIFSALYGILRPSDRIKAYRLDMNSKLLSGLYAFWKEKVTAQVAAELESGSRCLVNLASAEYFKLLDLKALPGDTRVITPVFQQEKNGRLTTNSLYAKYARGLMLRFMAQHRIEDPEHLQAFDMEGYCFRQDLSDEGDWYFTR